MEEKKSVYDMLLYEYDFSALGKLRKSSDLHHTCRKFKHLNVALVLRTVRMIIIQSEWLLQLHPCIPTINQRPR